MNMNTYRSGLTYGFSLVLMGFIFGVQGALGIDGPNMTAPFDLKRIPLADWGLANDPWPHVPRLYIDSAGNGEFTGTCTGTLIAPDVIVTAGHCVPFAGANSPIPPKRVLAHFGHQGLFLNQGGFTDGILATGLTSPIPAAPRTGADFAFLILGAPVTQFVPPPLRDLSPVAVLPRPPRVNDINHAIGFGCFDPVNPNNKPAGRECVPGINGFREHNGHPKNWSRIKVDSLTPHYVQQAITAGENFTERGDSGGPGIQSALPDMVNPVPDEFFFPAHAYGATIDPRARDSFVMSAVSGGNDIAYNPGTMQYVYPFGATDWWTRLDIERNFFNGAGFAPPSMRPTYQVFHNLPTNPALVNPNNVVKVLIKATYPAGSPYLLNIKVWEEDTALVVPPPAYSFEGDVALRNTLGIDDLGGYGHSAGRLPPGVTTVCAWDETVAGAFLPFDEPANPLDPPLDWVFQVNYADDLQKTDLTDPAIPLAAVDAQIALCQAMITAGTAVRGGLALVVPEPTCSTGLIVALCSGLYRRRARRG